MLSYSSFAILHFSFSSMIHFKLLFVKDVISVSRFFSFLFLFCLWMSRCFSTICFCCFSFCFLLNLWHWLKNYTGLRCTIIWHIICTLYCGFTPSQVSHALLFVKKTIFFSLYCLCFFVKEQLTVLVWVYFCLSVLTPLKLTCSKMYITKCHLKIHF